MPKTKTVKIMAVDPGGKTGVSFGVFPIIRGEFPRTVYGRGSEFGDWEVTGGFVSQVKQIEELWREHYPSVIAIEKFALRPGQGFAADLTPVEICAALEVEMSPSAWERVIWQTPSEAKGFVDDARLREWGAWFVGSDHIRDSRRHLIKAMSRYCCESGDLERQLTPKRLKALQARQGL